MSVYNEAFLSRHNSSTYPSLYSRTLILTYKGPIFPQSTEKI